MALLQLVLQPIDLQRPPEAEAVAAEETVAPAPASLEATCPAVLAACMVAAAGLGKLKPVLAAALVAPL
jgi:hypothetical protein